jgi:hypothetical protein
VSSLWLVSPLLRRSCSCSLLIVPLAFRGPFFASLALLLHSGFGIMPTVMIDLRLLHPSFIPQLYALLQNPRLSSTTTDTLQTVRPAPNAGNPSPPSRPHMPQRSLNSSTPLL